MGREVVQDVDKAIAVMRDAAEWLEASGKNPSKWWQPSNMTRAFLLQHAEPSEFYAVLVDGQPAAAAILQDNQRNQSWESVDGKTSPPALYIHWLCVARRFAGKGLPKLIIGFAERQAAAKGLQYVRVDANAGETRLRKIYEDLGFKLAAVVKEDYRQTAFYQKKVSKKNFA
jgi:GNAT superfamily N-acetyltransferase